MKLITRDADYSIRILKYLAKKDNYLSKTYEIKKDLKIPNAFLRKLVRLLAKSDILVSFKGKNGGIKLNKNPEDISIMNIIENFQEKFKLNECKFKGHSCPEQETCKLRRILLNMEKKIKNKLIKTKLKDII